MNIVSIIGFVAGALTTIAFLPQTIKSLRTKRAIDISLGLCSVNVGAAIFWTAYGVAVDKMPVIIPNVIASIIAVIFLASKLKYGMKKGETIKSPLLAIFPIVSAMPPKFLIGGVAIALGLSSFLPQVFRIWKLKETKDISLASFFLLWVGMAIWLAYGFLISDSVIIINNIINLSLVSAILVLKARYK